eukprot:CAMPEP_0181120396 /NCGR_PEP_ID=MMETSP1071-20121207/24134_1 /TAXON_ID=35127 /ORGANISM="Thalassiosira sp., Strain NH16" /LENGTH=338 /DNA_ID=CAMNT_0023205049 /DNA_START=393 /DNA_END=1409 /DNA_ORIENTATION=+
MTVITADQRPASSLLPEAMMSNPDLTKLYMSASCPDLGAESVVSSSDEEDDVVDIGRFEPLVEMQGEDDDDEAAPLSMDASPSDRPPPAQVEEGADEPASRSLVAEAPIDPLALSPSTSSTSSYPSHPSERRKLQWEFKGLTLWLELEEFDSDLTRAVEDFSSRHSSPFIPKPHTTAIYGMEHLTEAEASARLRRVAQTVGPWPSFARPTGVTCDLAVCGRPGQVCSIAWSELTLASDPLHEAAMDTLYRLFYDDDDGDSSDTSGEASLPVRDRPWKPHNSVAYDNPETNALSLLDTITYMGKNPTLLGRGRRVEAISLWNTEGKMEDWRFIDRVRFW